MQLLKFDETGEKDYPVALILTHSDVQILRNLLSCVASVGSVAEENRREFKSLQNLWALLHDNGYPISEIDSKLCGRIEDTDQ